MTIAEIEARLSTLQVKNAAEAVSESAAREEAKAFVCGLIARYPNEFSDYEYSVQVRWTVRLALASFQKGMEHGIFDQRHGWAIDGEELADAFNAASEAQL